MAERCMASQVSDCSADHFCKVGPGLTFEQHQSISNSASPNSKSKADIIQGLIADGKSDGLCVLELPRFLGRPCTGSRDDLLQRCGAQINSKDCNHDKACIWLRNGWWLEPDSKKQATVLSNENFDATSTAQASVPPSYACWPKWHVPYAAAEWPYMHWNLDSGILGGLPLACPVLASFYPCHVYTSPTDSGILLNYAGQYIDVMRIMGNTSHCIDTAGLDGVCPHLQVARKVSTGLQRGWDLTSLPSTQAAALIADCAQHSKFTGLQMINHPCIMQSHSLFSAFGGNQLPRRCGDLGYVPVVGVDCSNVTIDPADVGAVGADDRCLLTLVSSSWAGLGRLLLRPGTNGTSSPWYNKLQIAEDKCGTIDDWLHKCAKGDTKQPQASNLQAAAFNSVIRQYERMFLMDADANATAKAHKIVYRCQGSVIQVYRALAAVWMVFAGIVLLGIVGLMIYWHYSEGRVKIGWLGTPQPQLLLHDLQAQKAPAPVANAIRREQIRKVVVWLKPRLLWLKPRLHAVMFLVDVGLDIYTLVKLTSSRWMLQMLVAIANPYGLMVLLLVPWYACCCGICCLPAIFWYDIRMLFWLMGVQVPGFGDSKIAIEKYKDLRMLFEGWLESVPSALISTAVLCDTLGMQTTVHAIPVALLWFNLMSSFMRGATEIWGLAVLTHQQGYHCCGTTITQMVWGMLSYKHATTSKSSSPPTSRVVAAPPQLDAREIVSPPVQEPPLTCCATRQDAAIMESGGTTEPLPVGAASSEDGIMGDSERLCDCNCLAARSCCCNASINRSSTPGERVKTPCHLVLYVWFCVFVTIALCILTCIIIGCSGLLVRTATYYGVPIYRYGGEATCGAGSLFSALYMGSGGVCTLPNLEGV